jgi:NadR type nicotinamide-nucleotide adenylyltransferase
MALVAAIVSQPCFYLTMNQAKQFKRGLVVGKFCPLHKGHELLINHALQSCEQVTVISYTKPGFEHCGRTTRESWLKSLFPGIETLVIDDESLRHTCQQRELIFQEIPDNDAGDEIHRQFVGWLCWEVLSHTIDAVFTSENYGDGFAKTLCHYFSVRTGSSNQVTHVCVDKSRSAIPISGSAVRQNPTYYRDFLSPIVYASFIRRVCFLGGESSGKTTLAAAMASRFATEWVPEYGRELWLQKEGKLETTDMVSIARQQVAREVAQSQQATQWLFCDTSPLTTLFYSLAMFGNAVQELRELANREYDHVFLCVPDFPFVQDGTRQNSGFRERQRAWYLDELRKRSLQFDLISGSLSDRIEAVSRLLSYGRRCR